MKARQWWIGCTAITAITAGVLGTAYVINQQDDYEGAAATTIAAPAGGLAALQATPNLDTAELTSQLAEFGGSDKLGEFSAVIRDATSGQTIYSAQPETLMLPASATKMLTSVAAILELGPGAQIETTITQPDPTTLVINAAGDVWLDDAALADLAAQIQANVDLSTITTVEIRNTVWQVEEFNSGWDEADIAGGYIAPMQPAMLYGARQEGTTGDLPRTTTPMAEVASNLANTLGLPEAEIRTLTEFTPADEGTPVATWRSAALSERVDEMMAHSDNVMAEAIGRELSGTDPVGATLEILGNQGLAVSGLEVSDNSGLSIDNRISPMFFADLMDLVVSTESLHNVILGMPVAGGTGTLETRYTTDTGKGWVRAKTGTLTGVSAMVGVVPSVEGHLYTFALISNEASILDARAHMDKMLSLLREH
ncbi:MAG: D-alanyl-D-alanine carboxypeptidase [Corynebacterium sp.]|nr:D-alanyl-D-alanine carboxypeptidase [Corynebacterium sp.]